MSSTAKSVGRHSRTVSLPIEPANESTGAKFVKCNLCGADDFTILYPKGYAQLHRIVRCNRCSLMYANPQEHIDCEDFASRTPEEMYDPRSFENRQYHQKQQTQLPDNLRALRVLNDFFPKRGRLLEIGSFAGMFLDRIRSDGWSVTGLEPNSAVAKYSRSHYGLEIVEGVLPNPNLEAGSFDVVVMLHVIEHMPDPSASLRDIRSVLRKGGVVVVETPRFNSLLFKLLGRRERSMQNCPGHIFFFTEKTLGEMLRRAGFEVIKIERVGRTLTIDRFLSNVGLVTGSPRFQRLLMGLARLLGLNGAAVHVNARDMQRIYARAI